MLELPTANFYENYSDENVVNKSLVPILNKINIRYKDPLTIDKPELTIDKVALWQKISSCNYFYLPDTKRYYFIDDLTIDHGFVRIKGRTDVISSFWNYIKNKQCYINRQENVNSKYIVDNEYPVYATRDISVHNIPCDFLTGNSFVLTVSGGV